MCTSIAPLIRTAGMVAIAFAVLFPAGAQGQTSCPTKASASYSNDGKVTVSVSADGTCASGDPSWFIVRDDYIAGQQDGNLVASYTCPGAGACATTLVYDAQCARTGGHTVGVWSNCGMADANGCVRGGGFATADYSVQGVPMVSISSTTSTPSHYQFQLTWNFPHTNSANARGLYVIRTNPDTTESWVYNGDNVPQSGTATFDDDMTCAYDGTYTYTAHAQMCNGERQTATTTVAVNRMPSASVSASAAGPSNAHVTISYSFPGTNTADQRDLKAWMIEPSGYETPLWGAAPGTLAQSGTADFDFDTCPLPPGTYTIRAVAWSCNGDTKRSESAIPIDHTATITLALDKDANGITWAHGDYTVPDATPSHQAWIVVELLPNGAGSISRVWETSAPNSGHFDASLGDVKDPLVRAVALSCGARGEKFATLATNSCGTPPGGQPPLGAIAGDGGPGSQAGVAAGGPTSAYDPVRFWDGAVTYADEEPLPGDFGALFRREYSSTRLVDALFGMGWTSIFDASVFVPYQPIGPSFVVVESEDRNRVVFEWTGTAWIQAWPLGRQPGTLTGSQATGFEYRAGAGTLIRRFDGNGKLSDVLDLRSGRRVTITRDGAGIPTHVADDAGRWGVTVATAAGHITRLALDGRADLAWEYAYNGYQLQRVSLAGTSTPYRTYQYAGTLLTSVSDAFGHVTEQHTYDARSRATSSLGPSGDVTGIEYLSGSLPGTSVARFTRANGAQTSYEQSFAGGHEVTISVTGPCQTCGSNDTTWSYDDLGRAVRMQNGRGYISEYTYGPESVNVHSITTALRPAACDPESDTMHCRLSSSALASAPLLATPATVTVTNTYGDPNWPDRPTTVTRASVLVPANATSASFTYDAATGELLTQSFTGYTGADHHLETRTSTSTLYSGAEGAAFDPGGRFDAAWLTLAQPALRKSIDGPRSDVADMTTYVYYPVNAAVPATWRARLAAIRDAAGNIVRYENYDELGRAIRTVDANGVATEMTYDALGRLLTITVKGVAGCATSADPLCASDVTTTRSYASTVGPLASEKRPGGGVTRYEYDSRSRLSAVTRDVTAALQERAEYDYDASNARKSAERTLGGSPGAWVLARSEASQFDSYGRLAEVDHPDATKTVYTYNGDNSIATVQDENHSSANTTYAYDAAGRLTLVTQKLSTAPGGEVTTRYAYDLAGNLISVTDPNGNTTTYTYDDFGQMLQQTSPVTGTTTYGYDPAGNLTSSTDANGATTTRTYDALNRVRSAVSSRGAQSETVEWSYDDAAPSHFGRGRTASMTDPTGSAVYTYARSGQLATEVKTIENSVFTMAFTYDADGNRSTMTYPSGRVVNYSYDLADHAISAASGSVAYVTGASYLPFGPVTQIDYGNGTHAFMTYDDRYRPRSRKLTSAAGTLAEYNYAEDAVGNITQIHDAVSPGYNRDFRYDELNRLVGADTGSSLWGVGTYAYDAMGNMTSSTGPRSLSFAYDGTLPRLRAVTENAAVTNVAYDAAGNEIQHGTTASTYSPRNLLAGDGLLSYAYDGRSIRVITHAPTGVVSVSADAPTIFGGRAASFTVRIGAPAPEGGVAVELSSSNPALLSVPSSVLVPSGSASAQFSATAADVAAPSNVTITATHLSTSSVAVTVEPSPRLTGFTVDRSALYATQIAHGTLSISIAAPSGGVIVTLASSKPTALSVPASVTIPAGSTSTTFDITANSVTASDSADVAATSGATMLQTISVVPTMLASLTIVPPSVTAPSPATGTVMVDGVVPAAGAVVSLVSSDPATAAVPASITIPQAQTSGSFTISTSAATSSTVTITAANGGVSRSASLGVGTCSTTTAAPPATLPSTDDVWIDDVLPAGAAFTSGTPSWDATQLATGSQSLTMPAADATTVSGLRIDGLSRFVNFGANVALYVLIDPCRPTREIKLTYSADGRTASIYWGENLIAGPYIRFSRGALPAAGQWVRLEAPGRIGLGIDGRTVQWMQLETYGGKVWFDRIGTNGLGCAPAVAAAPGVPTTDRVLIDDALPAGSDWYGSALQWDASQKATGTQSFTSPYAGQSVSTLMRITALSLPVSPGDILVAYVHPNACVAVREIKLTFTTGLTDHSAYWGEARLGGETSALFMGSTLPSAGVWTRLEVPASALGLEGLTVDTLKVGYYAGQVWFDHLAVASATPAALTSFTADHLPPQPAGATITWTATATGSVTPLQYRFERQDNGVWSTVQPYGAANFYSWTPAASDIGDHTIRVSVRNAGSLNDFDDIATMAYTVVSGSGSLRTPWELLARVNPRNWWHRGRSPVALTIAAPLTTPPDVSRYSFYSPELHLIAETALTTSERSIAYEYIWFNGEPIAQADVSASATRWTFTDHLGTPLAQTTPAGTIDWRAEYEPYGEIFAFRSGPSAHQPLRFPGQEFDADGPEHQYNIFRWYQSGWGRYTQGDPIELEGGLNLLQYANANPLTFTDSRGLDTAGCDKPMPTLFVTRCVLQCCAAHDRCYDANHCSSASWTDHPQCGCDSTQGCKNCNDTASRCVIDCHANSSWGTKADPLYYCGAQHRYIRIPGDFASLDAAQKACQYDYGKDCKVPLARRPRKQIRP